METRKTLNYRGENICVSFKGKVVFLDGELEYNILIRGIVHATAGGREGIWYV